MKRQIICLATVTLVLAARTAQARTSPYQLVAVYTDLAHEHSKEVKLVDGAVIPDRADGLSLERIKIRFELAGFGATATGTFRNFTVGAMVAGAKQKVVTVESADINDSTSPDVLVWDTLANPARATPVVIDVRGKFSADFLCSQELFLRESRAKQEKVDASTAAKTETTKPKATTPKKQTDEEKAAQECAHLPQDPALPARSLITDASVPILYTYCAKPDAKSIDWAKAAKCPGYAMDGAKTADELRRAHKNALVQLMDQGKVLKRFMNPYAEIATASDDTDLPTNTYVTETVKLKVLHVGELTCFEEQTDGVVRLANVLAQDSTLLVKFAGGGTGACPDLAAYSYRFVIKGEGEQSTTDELKLSYRDGCTAAVEADLTKYLGKKVTLQVVQRLPVDQELTIATTTFQVAHLGLISTFPVVTEILTAVDGKSAADLTASSSLPLGIAIGRHDNTRLALTFPWKVSYNSRRAPDLARYFAIFAHLTVLANAEGDSLNTEVAVGVGISSFQFFHFAWAISLADNHRNYFVLSIDIKDVSKFVLGKLE
jgi:hypothetical protein